MQLAGPCAHLGQSRLAAKPQGLPAPGPLADCQRALEARRASCHGCSPSGEYAAPPAAAPAAAVAPRSRRRAVRRAVTELAGSCQALLVQLRWGALPGPRLLPAPAAAEQGPARRSAPCWQHGLHSAAVMLVPALSRGTWQNLASNHVFLVGFWAWLTAQTMKVGRRPRCPAQATKCCGPHAQPCGWAPDLHQEGQEGRLGRQGDGGLGWHALVPLLPVHGGRAQRAGCGQLGGSWQSYSRKLRCRQSLPRWPSSTAWPAPCSPWRCASASSSCTTPRACDGMRVRPAALAARHPLSCAATERGRGPQASRRRCSTSCSPRSWRATPCATLSSRRCWGTHPCRRAWPGAGSTAARRMRRVARAQVFAGALLGCMVGLLYPHPAPLAVA